MSFKRLSSSSIYGVLMAVGLSFIHGDDRVHFSRKVAVSFEVPKVLPHVLFLACFLVPFGSYGPMVLPCRAGPG